MGRGAARLVWSKRHSSRRALAAPDRCLRLEFPTAKLLDYDEATLQARRNPLAIVVMAHLRAKSTTGRARDRQASKLQLARELFSRGYSKKDIIHLLRALDGMLALPAALQAEFAVARPARGGSDASVGGT